MTNANSECHGNAEKVQGQRLEKNEEVRRDIYEEGRVWGCAA